jgi:hypothetical protein
MFGNKITFLPDGNYLKIYSNGLLFDSAKNADSKGKGR